MAAGRTPCSCAPLSRRATTTELIYEGIKRDFGDLPHVIFGRQNIEIADPAVLPYLTDAELIELYRTAPVFCYPHTEPRHLHYSPLEAVILGTPTLYLRGALMDTLLGGADLPAACADTAEMAAKARRLIGGDAALAEAIRSTQGRVLDAFDTDLARRQWAAALADTALPRCGPRLMSIRALGRALGRALRRLVLPLVGYWDLVRRGSTSCAR